MNTKNLESLSQKSIQLTVRVLIGVNFIEHLRAPSDELLFTFISRCVKSAVTRLSFTAEKMGAIDILEMAYAAAKTDEQRREIVLKYLERVCTPDERKVVEDFPQGISSSSQSVLNDVDIEPVS